MILNVAIDGITDDKNPVGNQKRPVQTVLA